MKKILALTLLFVFFIGPVAAQEIGADEEGPQLTGNKRGMIHYVHHDQQKLVIDDASYIMPINFKVSGANGKSLNRFALKAGQAVQYFVRHDKRSGNLYVDSVQLLN